MDAMLPSAMTERRTKRSQDPLVALHYQLASVREETRCDVVVLAERGGFVVAGAGSWPACEELAAFAPLLAAEPDGASPRVLALRAEVELVPVRVDGEEMFLLARGGAERRASVERAAEGVARILRAA